MAIHISHNHDNDNVINTSVNHSTTHTSNWRRRRKSSNRNRYWRYNNHNIHLDTSAVISLSNINLTHDETRLLARGPSFCPTPRHVNWTEVKADFNEFSRRMHLLEYFHGYPPHPKPALIHFVLKTSSSPRNGTGHVFRRSAACVAW